MVVDGKIKFRTHLSQVRQNKWEKFRTFLFVLLLILALVGLRIRKTTNIKLPKQGEKAVVKRAASGVSAEFGLRLLDQTPGARTLIKSLEQRRRSSSQTDAASSSSSDRKKV